MRRRLKTFKGGSVTPQDDAIIQQTVIGSNGIFKGCAVTHTRSNILHISQGFGMIKGRFFRVYETDKYVTLNSDSETIYGRLYIHMDLSNTDEPIQILTKTAAALPDLDADEDVNYNNSSYDLELATFNVSNTAVTNLVETCSKITGASGSSASSLQRSAEYSIGDFATCSASPKWVTLYCTQGGTTAAAEPAEYAYISEIGDVVADGDSMFVARDVIGELDALLEQYTGDIAAISEEIKETQDRVQELADELVKQTENLPAAVGTIRYSATDPGDEWLKCDGRYISAADYPELVEVLGKLIPDEVSFQEFAADNSIGRKPSNVVVKDGFFWVFSQVNSNLYRITIGTGDVKEIPATFDLGSNGTNFHTQDGYPVWLSIVDDALFLTQLNNAMTSPYVRVFKGSYSTDITTLTMTFQPIPSFMSGSESGESVSVTISELDTNFIPYVSKYTVDGVYCMMVGKYLSSGVYYDVFVTWSDGAWYSVTSVTKGYVKLSASYSSTSSYYGTVMTQCGFSWKNSGFAIQLISSSYNGGLVCTVYTVPGSYISDSITVQTTVSTWGQTLPLQAGGSVLYKMAILTNLNLGITYLVTSGTSTVYSYSTTVTVPKAATLFPESLTYVGAHKMWVCFAGTGFLFSRDPTTKSGWGYLDTTDKLGIITQMGGSYYDDDEQVIYFFGMTSGNKFRMAKLAVGEWFQYASDGAWLPMLASEGIPAYIKAVSSETTE